MMTEQLLPRGGGLVKNAIAAGLVRLGNLQARRGPGWDRVNRRVPAAAGGTRDYNDSFVFQGSSPDGTMFMSRIALREDGTEQELWVFLDLGGEKLVNTDTSLTAAAPHGSAISSGGLSYEYLPSEDCWSITYRGPLAGAAECEIDLVYRPESAAYLSSVHMDPLSTGKAMAEMPWSRDYFRKLGSERQVRMEQGGMLTGSATIDGKRTELELKAFRDHSWGKRDWCFINRYVWSVLSLNRPIVLDGEPFSYLGYATVDYGTSFKHLVSGWIAGPRALRPIVAASNMHALAADGVIPHRYPIVIQPRGSAPLRGEVRRSGVPHSWMLHGGRFEVNEAYCTFTLGGSEGQGMSELGFSDSCGIPRPAFDGEAR